MKTEKAKNQKLNEISKIISGKVPTEIKQYEKQAQRVRADMDKLTALQRNEVIKTYLQSQELRGIFSPERKKGIDLLDITEKMAATRQKLSFIKLALEMPDIYEQMGDQEVYGLFLLTNDILDSMGTHEKALLDEIRSEDRKKGNALKAA